MKRDFPHLENLIETYFHQDYDLIADDIEGLLEDYVAHTQAGERSAAKADIQRFLETYGDDLDAAFLDRYGFDVDPKLWGYTAEGFLRKLWSLIP